VEGIKEHDQDAAHQQGFEEGPEQINPGHQHHEQQDDKGAVFGFSGVSH
jgi:hypothetical protein